MGRLHLALMENNQYEIHRLQSQVDEVCGFLTPACVLFGVVFTSYVTA